MNSLFEQCFKDDGDALLEIAERCSEINSSEYLCSDIGLIINTMKLLITAPCSEIGKAKREITYERYYELLGPVLFDSSVKVSDFIGIIKTRDCQTKDTILIKLSNFFTGCREGVLNTLLLSTLIGIMSGIPENTRVRHPYEDFLNKKIHIINSTVMNVKKPWKRYMVLNYMLIKLVNKVYYDKDSCDNDMFNIVLTFINVHIIINVLQHNHVLNRHLSRMVFNNEADFLDKMLTSLNI